MKEKIVRYGKFKTKTGEEHCLAAIEYEDKRIFNYETQQYEKVGEIVHTVWNIRGGLNYSKKYGITKCCRYSSLQALMNEDALTYSNLNIEFYEPVEI